MPNENNEIIFFFFAFTWKYSFISFYLLMVNVRNGMMVQQQQQILKRKIKWQKLLHLKIVIKIDKYWISSMFEFNNQKKIKIHNLLLSTTRHYGFRMVNPQNEINNNFIHFFFPSLAEFQSKCRWYLFMFLFSIFFSLSCGCSILRPMSSIQWEYKRNGAWGKIELNCSDG